ncbi:MAG: hypothetical protein JWN04_6529, partial [Myxococcaceae bacterium]|nr:hypothetical protein [Myxococcaceae bacterium]
HEQDDHEDDEKLSHSGHAHGPFSCLFP